MGLESPNVGSSVLKGAERTLSCFLPCYVLHYAQIYGICVHILLQLCYVYIEHVEDYSAYTKICIARANVSKRGANGKISLFYFIRCTIERKYGENINFFIILTRFLYKT